MRTMTQALAATAACLILAATAARGEDVELKVGDKAPEWSMKGSDGKDYALKDFAGEKWVVVAWFPKAFTGG